jgi:arabinose-5-phosphate isomerase
MCYPPGIKSAGNAEASLIESAERTLEAEASGIIALSEALRNGLGPSFTAAAELMKAARGRVVVSGMGKSGHIGRKIAATLASTGTPAMFVHPAEASHGDLGMITADDVVLALSWSGETAELKSLITYAGRFSIGIIAMTAEADSTLAKAADVCLTLPKAREACPHNLAPTTSSLMQLALGDALAVALLENRGFSPIDFSVFHPGGKLGAQLTFVRDLMHTGDVMPLKPLGTLMSDALVEMSAKGFGCVGITGTQGTLIGIVTDGDLRRHMRPDLMTALVDEVMTPTPKTISPDMLASEAVEIIDASKISALFVTKGRVPLGIVHIHGLLRAGVV